MLTFVAHGRRHFGEAPAAEQTARLHWLVLGSFLVGIGKGGIGGVAALAVAIYALAAPDGQAAKAMALLVPVLTLADFAAAASYYKHAAEHWRVGARLFPWTLLGMAAGAQLLGRVDDGRVRRIIGCILLATMAAHFSHLARGAKPSGRSGGGSSSSSSAQNEMSAGAVALAGLVGGCGPCLCHSHRCSHHTITRVLGCSITAPG
jgi:uncharacterized membrane protein YfcA